MLRAIHSLLLWYGMAQLAVYGQTIRTEDSITHFQSLSVNNGKLRISAHRGASDKAPENTLATFRAALAMHVDYIEIDVRTTKDDQLVILHDGTLDRTTNGTGPVREQTLANLKTLSTGKGFGEGLRTEQIPTLDEVCQLLVDWNAHQSSKTNLYVDCKDVAPAPLVACLTKYDLLNDAVFYGPDAYLVELQHAAPKVKVMPTLKKGNALFERISKLHPYAFDVNWSFINKKLVRQIHRHGIKVFSDLLDGYDRSDEYVRAAHLGIDVIQTDHVLRVHQALATETRH